MKQWNRMTKHFGEVAENTILNFVFEYYGDEKYKSHKESCSCISSKWKDNKLYIEFDVGPLGIPPENIVNYRQSTKSITIKWESGNTHVLFLKAHVYHKDDL